MNDFKYSIESLLWETLYKMNMRNNQFMGNHVYNE